MKGKRRILAWVLAAVAALALVVGGITSATAAEGGAPANSKRLIDNGDGTYTLALSVTGAAESSTTTEVTKANVILVLDTSSSMNNSSGTTVYTYTEYTGTSNNPQKWGQDDEGNYFEVYYRNGAWRTANQNNAPVYNGTVYQRNGGAVSRLNAEKDALTKDGGIVDNLLSQNVSGDPNKSDIIEVAVVSFATRGTTQQTWTTNGTTLKNTINGLTTSTGTNWEEGLMRAEELADAIKASQPNEDVYIIFLTDGEPTTHYNSYNVSTNYATQWGYASDNARAIVTDGYIFYGLFTWGNSGSTHYLSSLVQYAYTGSGNSSTALDPAYAQYYTDASDTATLIEALNQIVHDITTGVGYTNVEMTDGVTSMTTSSVKATPGGDVTGIKYYRSGGSYSTTDNNGLGEEWTDAPKATINENGEVDWDLGDLVLEDGVTYTIAFTVWPSQESLDLVADLNNGIISYDELTADQKSQIQVSGGHYTLKTNTDYPTITYSTVTTTTVDGETTTVVSDPQTATITQPDPVGLAEEKLNAVKEWEDTLDPSQREEVGTSVTLYLMVDGEYYYVNSSGEPMGVVLTEDSDWTETDYLAIAPGIMVTSDSPAYPGDNVEGYTYVDWDGAHYAILESGHNYVWEESDINHHFELTAYTHHPMIMGHDADGNPVTKDVVFTYDGSGNITGIESVEEMGDTLSATNTLKGGINITKKVVGEDGVTEVEDLNPFTITVTVTDPDGNPLPAKTAYDDDGNVVAEGYTIDYRIYYGENNPAYETSGDKHRSDHIYVTGTSFEETLYVGDTIRVVNVEDDSIYTVTETAPTGYELVGVEYSIAYGTESATPVPEGEDATVQGNSASYAEVTNKLVSGSLEVSKTVEVESGDEEQAKDQEFEFTFKLYADDTKAEELEGYRFPYTITKADDSTETGTIEVGGTFTLKDGDSILIEQLPEAAYYEITETEVDGYATTKTGDTGTIVKNETAEAAFTNTYSVGPVVVDPPVKKDITGTEDLYNGGDFTFTIENTAAPEGVTAPMPTNRSITNSATYELEDKPGYYEFGEITFTEPGTYTYTVTESGSVVGVTNDEEATKTITFTVTDNGDGTMTVTPGTDSAVFNFTNVYKTGELDITKTVVNNVTSPDNTEFTFTVTFKDADGNTVEGSFPYTIGETTGDIASGGTLKLTNGQTAKITEVPDGVTYTVTEDEVAGYATTKTGDEGTIDDETVSTAAFTNTYSVEPTDITLSASKRLTADEGLTPPDVSEQYTFTLTGDGGVNQTAKNPDGRGTAVAFEPIQYTEPGTYHYQISESGTVAGVTNDSQASGKNVTVTVTDNGDGTLTAEVTFGDQTTVFTNTYGVEPTTITLSASKTLEVEGGDNAPDVSGKYTLTLTGSDDGVSDTKTNPDGEGTKVDFDEITYTAPGTYTYTVTESGTVAGVTNGTTSYTVVVTVTDNGDGTLSAAVTSGDQITAFTNTYSVAPTTASFPVAKELVVPDGLVGPEEWSYNIFVDAVGDAPEADTMSGKVDQDTTSLTFGDFEFTAPGTYEYTVTEIGTVAGVTNDSAAELGKTVTITVVDNGDGTLTATVAPAAGITFTNTYGIADPTEVEIEGTKVLTGVEADQIENYQFKFQLKDAEGNVVATATIDGDGNFTFDEKLAYTQDDMTDAVNGEKTFEYTATEVAGTEPGMTYDDTIFTVFVKVIDNTIGQLEATVTYEANGESADGIEFTNEFVPGSSSPTGEGNLTVNKSFTDADGNELELAADQFSFTLTPASGAPGETQTKGNAADGTVSFDNIKFTKAGDFEYTVAEVKGSNPAITYDESTYTVVAHVEDAIDDNGEHYLDVTWSIKGSDETAITFVNTYDTPEKTVYTGGTTTVIDGEVVQPGDTLTYSITYTNPTGKEASVTITDNIPAHTTYVSSDPEGSESGGTITWNLTVAKDETVTVTFDVTVDDDVDGETLTNEATVDDGVNEYDTNEVTNPTPPDVPSSPTGEGNLSVTKELTGRDLKAGEFEFTLTPQGDAPGETQTKTNAADGTVEFDDITFIKAGEFKYVVAETKGDLGGVTYDETTYTVVATVTQNADDPTVLDVEWSIEGSDETAIVFENTYASSGTVSFPAVKELVIPAGLEGPTEASWTFTLTGADGAPMPDTTSYTVGDGDKATFGTITYTQADAGKTYTYTITETGEVAGVTNDSESAKTVTVNVVDNGDGTITATASATADSPVKFTNTYGVEPTDITLSASKTLAVESGDNAPDVSGKYTFTLTGDGGVNQTAKNPDGRGTAVDFEAIQYTEPGTYHYQISESGTVAGVTNDSQASGKNVTVTVTDNGDGTLTAEVTFGDQVTAFTNTYAVSETSITLSASKTLEVKGGDNAPDVSGKYTLALTGSDDGVSDTKTNPDGKGTKVDFDEITYTAPGTYTYTVEESGTVAGVTNGTTSYTVVVTVTDNGDGTLSAAVTSGDQVTAFTNTYDVQATEFELSAAKVLEVKAPANNAPDVSGKYTITIAAASDGAPLPETTSITNADGDGTATSFGTIEYAAPGEYQYTITESGEVDGVTNGQTSYTVIVKVTDNGDGTLTAAVTSGDQTTTFTNTYSVTPVTLSTDQQFTVSKALTGTPLSAGAFEFTLTGADGAPMPEKTEATNDASGKVVFDTITYDAPGTYTYTIAEKDGGAGGYTYDTNTVTVTVTVVDNGKGELEATVSYSDDTTFDNTYEASGDVTLTAAKELKGTSLEEGQFTFELLDENGEVIQTKTNNASGAVQFDPISYDQTIFDDEATEEDPTTKAAEAEDEATVDEAEATEADPMRGAVIDDEAAADEPAEGAEGEATFAEVLGEDEATEVEAAEATEPAADEAVEAEATEPAADETAGPLEFLSDLADFLGIRRLFAPTTAYADEANRTKTFTYTIREVNDGKAGYTYDSHTVTVTVTVTDNGDGTLTAVAEYDGDTTFTNTYSAEGATGEGALCGVKTVTTDTERELEDGQFSFQLKDSDGNVVETVTNDADGNFEFSALSFVKNADKDETGEHTYTIVEVNDGQAGYTYDSHVCDVTINVTDNGDGTLTCTVEMSDGGEASFDNPYAPLATSAQLKGVKQLTGKTLTAGMFTFELKDEEGEVVATVTNAADGSIDFGTFEFDEEGTFTYVATEVAGNDENMTYDTAEKTFTITVTDENGQLKATVDCDGSDVATFKNTYEEPPAPPVVPETGDATSVVAMASAALFGFSALTAGLALRRRDD